MNSVQSSVFDENASVSRSTVKQQASGLQERRSVAFATPARKPLGNVSNDVTKSSKRPATARKSVSKPMSSAAFTGTPALRTRKVATSRATVQKHSEQEDFDEINPFEDFLEPPTHEFAVGDVTSELLTLRSEFTPLFAIPAKHKKCKKTDPWKSSRRFVLSIKRNRQEVDDDDYCAVREKDKEYLAGINVDTLLC